MKTFTQTLKAAEYRLYLRTNTPELVYEANKLWDERPSNTMWGYADCIYYVADAYTEQEQEDAYRILSKIGRK